MIKIAIIGGGPGGVSLCMQLKMQLAHAHLQREVELIVFEKTARIGRGLPYCGQEDCHILNLPKQVMDPLPGERNQFAQWHAERFEEANQTSFPPRHHFGSYLEFMAIQTQLAGEVDGLKISYLTEHEVFDIQEEQNGLFNIRASHGYYAVHYVILSTGHMPSTLFTECVGYEGYLHNPWNMSDYEQIPLDKTVCILGTRLTAIDAALKLKNRNHKGAIIMASRSGLLPTVFGQEIPAYSLKHITTKSLYELRHSGGGYLKLKDLALLFGKEIDEASGHHDYLKRLPISSKDISALDWLNNEILDAEQGASSLQQVLFALYPIIPTLWSMLCYEDQSYFLKNYNSLLNNYLAAFPLDNAYKIKDMLSSGYIEICSNLTKVECSDGKFKVHVDHKEIRTADYIINATGPGYDPTKVALFMNMIDKALIAEHSLGGIQVDNRTFQVINGDGIIKQHLYAIGELTKGACLLTSELGLITAQAQNVTANLVNQLVEDKKKIFSRKSLS